MSLRSKTASDERASVLATTSVGVDTCGDCIQLTVGMINILLNYLLNGEIGGDCNEECGLLKDKEEYELCDAV
jgi:hypothetical protein